MIVADLMTKGAASVETEDSLAAAAEKMWQNDCGALPVVQEDGTVVGMITDRDICMATWSRGSPPADLHVLGAMSTNLIVCRPADALKLVESAMRSNQIRRIPVVDQDQRLLGIVSLADIARRSDGDGTSATLASICQRVSEPVILGAHL